MRWHRLALLLALAGCGGEGACGLVGCVSQLTVRLPAGTSAAEACVEGVCTSAVRGDTLQVPLSRRAEGSSAVVVVTVAGTRYEGEVALERSRPNGERCPPVCVTGTARVDPGTGRVVAAAS